MFVSTNTNHFSLGTAFAFAIANGLVPLTPIGKRDVQHAEHPQNPPDTLRATATFAGGWSFGPASR